VQRCEHVGDALAGGTNKRENRARGVSATNAKHIGARIDQFQPAMQAMLATLADIDFAHEHELEKVNSSVIDDSFKMKLVTKLDQLHRDRREPYEQERVRLHEQMRSLMNRVPAGESRIRSGCIIASGSEVVGALGGCEGIEDGADAIPESADSAFRGLAQERLQLGEGVLDRVEVGPGSTQRPCAAGQ
jgi:hypothetical protein